VPQGLDSEAVTVKAGFDNTCAINKYGSIICWGNNQDQQCDVPYEVSV